MPTLQPTDRTGQSVDDIYRDLAARMGGYTPAFELRVKAELAYEINQLKVARNAVILGHNYMEAALFHTIPDYVGDSLDLSRKAAATDRDIIIFCGVRFMAETAKILNPSRTVLLPSLKAGCSLAASITADDVRALKARFPGVPIVTYVNTYADVKAENDICCVGAARLRSSNRSARTRSSSLARRVPGGTWPARRAKHHLPARLPNGQPRRYRDPVRYGGLAWSLRVHEQFNVADIADVRAQFPDVVILATRSAARRSSRPPTSPAAPTP